ALLIYYLLAADYDRCGEIGALLTLVVAIPGLILRWVISPALFLIMLTYLLIDPNFRNLLDELARESTYWSYPYRRGLSFDDVLLVASILVYLMAQFRVLSFIHKSMPADPPPRRKGQPEPATPRRPYRMFVERELGIFLPMAALCLALGVVGWLLISR